MEFDLLLSGSKEENIKTVRVFLLLSYLLSFAVAAQGLASDEKPQPSSTKPTKKLALLVGINKYADPANAELRGAVNDARLMETTLLTDYEFPRANVRVLVDQEATRESILKAFHEHLISQAAPDTVVAPEDPLTKLLARQRFGSKQIPPIPIETGGWSTDVKTIEVQVPDRQMFESEVRNSK